MLLNIALVVLSACFCHAVVIEQSPHIKRPCKTLSHECIRENLAANSACSANVVGAAPALYAVARARFETPNFNASYEDINLVVRGLDRCYVSEYFYNRVTNHEVLGVSCPWLNFESDRKLYQHRSFNEDQIYSFHINGSYPLIRLTTTLRSHRGLNICKDFTYVEVAELPIFHIDPKDKKTDDALTTDLSKLMTYEREMFAHRGNMLMSAFVNSVICDFKC